MQQRPKKLLEQVRDVIQLKHHPYRTEETVFELLGNHPSSCIPQNSYFAPNTVQLRNVAHDCSQ